MDVTRALRSYTLSLFLIITSFSAHAALGGNSDSVRRDQIVLRANLTVTEMNGYKDFGLALPTGGSVHEFVSPSGRVFEITWSKKGSRPDMNQLLGEYIERFSGQVNGGGPTSRHADRIDADFVLHSKVLNRYFSGTAHIPSLIPNSLHGPVHHPVEHAQ